MLHGALVYEENIIYHFIFTKIPFIPYLHQNTWYYFSSSKYLIFLIVSKILDIPCLQKNTWYSSLNSGPFGMNAICVDPPPISKIPTDSFSSLDRIKKTLIIHLIQDDPPFLKQTISIQKLVFHRTSCNNKSFHKCYPQNCFTPWAKMPAL